MRPARVTGVLPSLTVLLVVGAACAAKPGPIWRRGLAVMPAAGGESRELVHEPRLACGSPRWSPDGEWVAYDTLAKRAGGRQTDWNGGRIWVVRSDGSEKRAVGFGGMPTWSPDGTDLAWHTYDDRGVVVARVDGSAEETIVNHWGSPVWLRDGSRIMTISRGGLAAYDPRVGKETETVSAPGINYGYSVSPDGKWVSYRSHQGQLMIASFDPVIAPRVRIATGKAGYSSWSPDGERIVVSWAAPGASRYHLYTLSPHGEEAPRLVPGQREQDAQYQPDWSADGEWIVFNLQRRVGGGSGEGGGDGGAEPWRD